MHVTNSTSGKVTMSVSNIECWTSWMIIGSTIKETSNFKYSASSSTCLALQSNPPLLFFYAIPLSLSLWFPDHMSTGHPCLQNPKWIPYLPPTNSWKLPIQSNADPIMGRIQHDYFLELQEASVQERRNTTSTSDSLHICADKNSKPITWLS